MLVAGHERANAAEPFRFWGCAEVRESLGMRAESERQLVERLERVPPESIYHHTVRCLLQRPVEASAYPDDFAQWVAVEVRDAVLAERLALSSPFDFADVEAFRQHLLEVLDDHLARLPFAPRALGGAPFLFLRSHLAAVPLDLTAVDLRGFLRALVEVDESSLYYHAVEALGRLGKPRSDFAAWVDECLGQPALAARLAEVDPFVTGLAGLRRQFVEIVEEELAAERRR